MPRRTTIEVDDALLEQAQAVLGTTGLKDTVDEAMRQAVRRARLSDLARLTTSGELGDRDPALLLDARR